MLRLAYFPVLLFTLTGILASAEIPPSESTHDSPAKELAYWQKKYEGLEKRLRTLGEKFKKAESQISDLPNRYIDAPNVVEGRLTLQSGTPVSTTDQSGTVLYFTPYHGSLISLYDGTQWVLYRFTEKSLALSMSSGSNYDVFAVLSGGAVTIELGGAWTSDTARAATSSISLQDGVYVKDVSGAPDTSRKYLGTIRAASANTAADTFTQRYVWNYQNKVMRPLRVADTAGGGSPTNTWTYSTGTKTWRQANAQTSNKVEFVFGITGQILHLFSLGVITNATGSLNYYASGIGIDSTTANSSLIYGSGSSTTVIGQAWSEYLDWPGIGYHAANWIENSHTASNITVWGDNNDATKYRSGLLGYIFG